MQICLYTIWYIAQAMNTFLMLKAPSKQSVCHSRRIKLVQNAPKTRRNLGLEKKIPQSQSFKVAPKTSIFWILRNFSRSLKQAVKLSKLKVLNTN